MSVLKATLLSPSTLFNFLKELLSARLGVPFTLLVEMEKKEKKEKHKKAKFREMLSIASPVLLESLS